MNYDENLVEELIYLVRNMRWHLVKSFDTSTYAESLFKQAEEVLEIVEVLKEKK